MVAAVAYAARPVKLGEGSKQGSLGQSLALIRTSATGLSCFFSMLLWLNVPFP